MKPNEESDGLTKRYIDSAETALLYHRWSVKNAEEDYSALNQARDNIEKVKVSGKIHALTERVSEIEETINLYDAIQSDDILPNEKTDSIDSIECLDELLGGEVVSAFSYQKNDTKVLRLELRRYELKESKYETKIYKFELAPKSDYSE